MWFSFLKKKLVKENVRPLDPAFVNFRPEKGAG
jgi:hypothetical protein